jgi:hypothetical protein
MKINLQNCTFLIPLKIESEDRKRNASLVLNYLLDNLNTNIHILEAGSNIIPNIVDISQQNIKYLHVTLSENEPFHKTKYLNILSKNLKTDVVACYDIDVILPLTTYELANKNIINGDFDIIYPYGEGMFQRKVTLNDPKNIFSESNIFEPAKSIYGHCNFCNYKKYEEIGFENENFISYGPEDQEKLYRYLKLGYKVGRINDLIYHLEHSRGKDSNTNNVYFNKNVELFKNIKQMSIDELKLYYNIF